MVAMVKSSLFKKPGRESRYLKYLNDFIASSEVKLPPVPVSSRWNSWFEAVCYHATRVHIYEGFFKAEKGEGMAVQRIIELLSHKIIYPEIILQLYFIKENCPQLMTVLTALEEKKIPLACKVFNYLEDLKMYLRAGIEKSTFGTERTGCCLSYLSTRERSTSNRSRKYFNSHHKNSTNTLIVIPVMAITKQCVFFILGS